MNVINRALVDSKAFHTATAEFALAGDELRAEIGIDGTTRLYAIHHSRVVSLDDLEHARAFLAQIGGSHA